MLFPFHNPTCANNQPYNLHQNFSSMNFSSLVYPYLFIKLFLQSPLTLTSSMPQHYFCIQQPLQSTSKVFSLLQPISQFRLRQGNDEQGSFVTTGTVLISILFFKVFTGITRLTIADSLFFRLRKLVSCMQQSLIKMLAIRMQNHPIHLPSYHQSIVITSIPYYYYHNNSYSSINQILNLIFILSLAFSYNIYASLTPYVLK